MLLYFELIKKPVFTIEDLKEYYCNTNTCRTVVKRLMKDGLVAKIRNNMYTCIDQTTGWPVANKFQIASNINEWSYVSHHTAFEYYGIMDRQFYDIYVSSDKFFRDFEFDGYHYHYVKSISFYGVDRPEDKKGVSVTDIERTIVDSLKDMDKIEGMEEVISNIRDVTTVNEEALLDYLSIYDNQFLYQKMGFVLENFCQHLNLSDYFFDVCQEKIGKSKRYFTNNMIHGTYVDKWKLVVPKNLYGFSNGNVDRKKSLYKKERI